jgi:modification target Cys-rich repeat protein
VCPRCGDPTTGDFNVSGNAQIDGFLVAFGTLETTIAGIRWEFEANVLALASVYGVRANGFSAALVDDLIDAIKADVAANASSPLRVIYGPPECSASVATASRAQAECEAKFDCNVAVSPGSTPVQCDGACAGTCSGNCVGSASCVVKGPVSCTGNCEGTCEMSTAGVCDGVCYGVCNGSCSLIDTSGQCQGICAGTCRGACELQGLAACAGLCHGSCFTDPGAPECKGDVGCNGSCDAQCTGRCEGNATPPGASINCDASEKCKPQAVARANANFQCSPPRLDFSYEFRPGTTIDAQVAFVARLRELEARAAPILQASATLSALVNGVVDGRVVYGTPPMTALKDMLSGFASADAIGSFRIPPGRLPCVVPAIVSAARALTEIQTNAADTVTAQAKFVTYVLHPT